jgi:hypothetical protein
LLQNVTVETIFLRSVAFDILTVMVYITFTTITPVSGGRDKRKLSIEADIAEDQKVMWNAKNVFIMHNVSHPSFFKCPTITDEKIYVSSVQPVPTMLSNFIGSMPPEFSEHGHERIIIRNLLGGLKAIHERTYVLVSITPDTVAVQYNKDHIAAYFADNCDAQWCPIGKSVILGHDQPLTPYHAPECHIKRVADAKSDIYSIGALWVSVRHKTTLEMSSTDDIFIIHKALVTKVPDAFVSDMILFHSCERPPLSLLYPMFLHAYQMEPLQEPTRANGYTAIFQQLYNNEIQDAVCKFREAANSCATDSSFVFVVPTFVANIVDHFAGLQVIMSGHSIMMLSAVAIPLIDLLIFLQERGLFRQWNYVNLDSSRFSTVIIVACDHRREAFLDVVKTLVSMNVFKLTRETLLRFIDAKMNFECLHAIIQMSDEIDLKSYFQASNIQEHKRRIADLEKENETLKSKQAKIAELCQT